MRLIRNWYTLLEGAGLVANDSGPGAAHGSLTANVTWYPFYSPPFSTLYVAGSLTPDATGTYILTGNYAAHPYWFNTKGYYLWWDVIDDFWTISTALGSFTPGYWYAQGSPTITGNYTPNTYTGTPVVTSQYTVPYDQKGVVITSSLSRILTPAAAGFNSASGSIEMLVSPYWNNADSTNHTLWSTAGGQGKQFILIKASDNKTYLYTQTISRGSFTYAWTEGQLYHIVLNWGTNALYINKILEKTFTAADLGLGASTLYIGDYITTANYAFNGIIYYLIARDVPLTLAEITTFYNFFTNLYIPQPT
jgi:hypothetical protein